MAFVRKVRTASGAVAVQVVRKHRGRHEIIAHVGSAHTDVELGILLERSRNLLHGDQGMLELDVPSPVEQITDVADWRTGQLSVSPPTAGREVAGPGRTVRTTARLLYDVLASVYDRLGFDVLDDAVFKDLVIARIVEPTSKIDALRVLDDLGADTVSYKTIQRHLAQILTGDYRDRIAHRCFEYAAATGGLGLLLFDVTTLYFEAEKEDDLRKVGYSKERRVDPQIVVGLLVDRTGFPLEIGCFEGNKAETHTLIPIVRQFQTRHGIDGVEMVIAADAGMLSASNLTALDEAGLKFIVGSRVTKAPGDLTSHFHWHGGCVHRWADHRHRHTPARTQCRQHREETSRTGLGSGAAPHLVAGDLAVHPQTRRARQPNPQCAGSAGEGGRRRHEEGQGHSVRQDHHGRSATR
ncbi:hypothetical protein AIIKEEIJ_06119 [Rhodococcus sp. YH1]|nr:hypothetical protein [Rhodococcus sp. YH1]NCL78614.1 hypothetical protein [Rhodococcus sp. YH1]